MAADVSGFGKKGSYSYQGKPCWQELAFIEEFADKFMSPDKIAQVARTSPRLSPLLYVKQVIDQILQVSEAVPVV